MVPFTTVVTGNHSLSTFRQTAGTVNLEYSDLFVKLQLENDGRHYFPDIQQGVFSSPLCNGKQTTTMVIGA